MALSAWFWVLAATLQSTARYERNSLTSVAPISLGCLLLWNRMNLYAQSMYERSVRME